MKTLTKYTWMETKLFMRQPIGAFFTLIFPLIILFIFGSIHGNDPLPELNGYGTVDISIPAYIGMIIGTTGIMVLTITISSYRETGVLRRLRATPLGPQVILAAHVIVLFIMTMAGTLLLILVGELVYDLRFGGDAINVILAFTLGSLSFFSLGFVLASIVPNARTGQVVGLVILYPMIFLSGAGIPLDVLPDRLRNISIFLPLTHAVTLLQSLWMGDAWSQHTSEVIVLTGLLIVGIVFSAKFFTWE